MSTRPAVMSASSCCSAGRAIVAPEHPPSSYPARRHTQPSCRWLSIKASQASRCARSERHCLPDLIVMPRHISNQTAPDERHEREGDATPVEPRETDNKRETETITAARPKYAAHGIKVSNE